jgi:uncharacterized membrane protein YjjP (DUF1212 family)
MDQLRDNREGRPQEIQHSSEEPNADSSTSRSQSTSRPTSANGEQRREKHRVRFTTGGESLDPENHRAKFDLRDEEENLEHSPRSSVTRASPAHSRQHSLNRPIRHHGTGPNPAEVHQRLSEAASLLAPNDIQRPKPSVLRNNSVSSNFENIIEDSHEDDNEDEEKAYASKSAQNKARRLSRVLGTRSAPGSARTSPTISAMESPPQPPRGPNGLPVRFDDIPLAPLDKQGRGPYGSYDTDSDEENVSPGSDTKRKKADTTEAYKLVRMHTNRRDRDNRFHIPNGLQSGQATPEEDRDPEDWVPRPQKFRGGILSSLMKLYGEENGRHSRHGSASSTPGIQSRQGSNVETPIGSPGSSSGTTTPKRSKWYQSPSANQSTSSLSALIGASSKLGAPAEPFGPNSPDRQGKRPPVRKGKGGSGIGNAIHRLSKPRLEDEIRITVHIAETISRQKYIVKLCRALMSYGAPTHRLEEYMKMTARVLEIEGQFLYLPGCMIISFDDSSTHTTEVKIVRLSQGVDLGKLKDVHEIYKEVVHDIIGVEEAHQRLEQVIARKDRYHPWIKVFVFGLASACVGPFAFGARFIDLPVAFLLGAILGWLQLIVAPKSELYTNVFEVSAAVITSFLARAFGSIRGGNIFCFSALAQSSIALILPGYTVLTASLELQSRSIVPGSVRMVYAIIYSLFLGFGITIGTAIYGLMDRNASSDTHCKTSLPKYVPFVFVPLFTLCLIIINQAKWRQAPVMLTIAFAGYVVNFFTNTVFPSNAQISNTLGALTVGVLGNLYSRLVHGVAAAALLPAIFVQVPSGLAASGSLVSGIQSADRITGNATAGINGTNTITAGDGSGQVNSIVFNVGYSMIQVAIGITVGLFLSALIVYPFGKRRSGLFSF